MSREPITLFHDNPRLRPWEQTSVCKFLLSESCRRNKIEHTRLWRIGVVTPDTDNVREPMYPEKYAVVGVQPQPRDEAFMDMVAPVLIFGSEGAGDFYEAVLDHVLENVWEKKILRTERNGFLCQHRVRVKRDPDGLVSVPDGIEVESPNAFNAYVPIEEFLQEQDFVVRPAAPHRIGIFTMEVSGIVVRNDGNEILAIRDPYFVHRSLIDDEGNLIYLGLDEGVDPPVQYPLRVDRNFSSVPFPVYFAPLAGYDLAKYTERNLTHYSCFNYTPLFRYTYCPIATEIPLPLLDIPLSSHHWFDVFIRPDGKATVYAMRPNLSGEQMCAELQDLWNTALAKKGFRLLGFTKDIDHVESYLRDKLLILNRYFENYEYDLKTVASDDLKLIEGIGSYNQKLWIANSIKAAYPWGEYKPKNSGDRSRRKDTSCSSLSQMTLKRQKLHSRWTS